MSMELFSDQKITSLPVLAHDLRAMREQGRTIVMCHGDFDRLHVDDILHLREAKAMGDVLVVTVAPDRLSSDVGPGIVFPQSLRAELVSAVDVVDYVAPSDSVGAADVIRLLAPHIYAKTVKRHPHGVELTTATLEEQDAVRAIGGSLMFTNTPRHLANYLDCFSPEVNSHLEDFRARHSTGEILRYLEQLRSLRVVLIGETILDEYVYCDALGKSGKESVLAMRYLSKERHAGGSLAIANHLANFCQDVKLYTYLGSQDSQEDFVRTHLSPKVQPTFIHKPDSPTILKRRYLDYYSRSKLFALYELNDDYLPQAEDEALCDAVSRAMPQCDLVVVADFGHGLVTPSLVQTLAEKAPFIAVNTQLNAANVGYHTISKYPRADFISIHEGELRLDSRCRREDLRVLMRNLSERSQSKTVLVTRGKNGSLLYDLQQGFFQSPAFATKIVDRIGAGDAVYALTSLCAARGVPPEVLNFLGNLMGAQAVAIVGNRETVDRKRLANAVDSILEPYKVVAA